MFKLVTLKKESMKKKIVFIAVTLVISSVAVLNVKTVLDANNSYDLTLASIEAMGENSEGGGSDSGDEYDPSGGGIDTQEACRKMKGYWNMALVITQSGQSETKCEVDGKLSLFGVEVSFSCKKGKTYIVLWSTYACTNSLGNCCIPSEQGVKVNSINLKDKL